MWWRADGQNSQKKVLLISFIKTHTLIHTHTCIKEAWRNPNVSDTEYNTLLTQCPTFYSIHDYINRRAIKIIRKTLCD